MTNRIISIFVVLILAFAGTSCQKDEIQRVEVKKPMTLVTKSILPEEFDWETADWMPTPPGQTQISVPWIGAGSLAGSHGIDVLNDYKRSDGWRLLYSTFSENASGPLVDPYFILYNVYRGTMRIYLYVTTQFTQSSVYLRDMLSVNATSGVSTNMLSFLQSGIIDPDANITCISQVQPKPLNGGSPFASNKWYMMEYEMAYDSNICNLTYQNIQLAWQLDFCSVSNIALNGNANASINSVVSSTSNNNPFGSLSDEVESIVHGGIAIGGLQYLETQKTSGKMLGLNGTLFNILYTGVKSIVNNLTGGTTSFVEHIFNSIFGGTTTSSAPIVNMMADVEIKMKGSSSVSGSFPSMPVSWYIPGSYIASSAQNYIPLENEALGVIGWKGDNKVTVKIRTDREYLLDEIMNTGYRYRHDESVARLTVPDFSSCIQINPAVLEVADVQIVAHDIVAYDGADGFYEFPMYQSIYENPWESPDYFFPDYSQILARFIIKVDPKDGAPATYLYKTFDIDYDTQETIINH